MSIAAVTGWSLSELASLPAREMFAYGVACIERRAEVLAEAIDAALVTAEAQTGGNSLRKRLQSEIRRMLGESWQPAASMAEQAAIAEVEREIVHDYPFYFDDARLSELHERYGRLRLRS